MPPHGFAVALKSPKTLSTVSDINGHFDKNGFLMDVNEVRLKFWSKTDIDTEELRNKLTVRSYKK